MSREKYSHHEETNGTIISTEECTVKMESSTKMEVDLKENPTACSEPNQSSPLRRKVTYINKKNSTSFLKLSIEDVQRLRNEKALYFYNSHSMSFLKVHTFTPKNQIQIETPHNSVLREAVVFECEVSRLSIEGSQELSGLGKDSKEKSTIKGKEGGKASHSDTMLSKVKIKDVEFEASSGEQCWQRDNEADQHFTPHQDSFHQGTSVEKVDNTLSVGFNHCSSFKMKVDSSFQPVERWAKIKSNQSRKSKAAGKVRKML